MKEETGDFKVYGCSLEAHKHAHIETALCNEDESGLLIIGKNMGDQDVLCLTAFIIPRGQTIYIPPDAIHTNDYQRGKWRSYSEVDDETVFGSLVKKSKNTKNVFMKFYDGFSRERLKKYEILKDDEDDNGQNLQEKKFKFVHFHDDSTKLLTTRIHE